jgi:ATP-dependent Clp endopeptidase proteolytic subunit ClpP
MEYIYTIDAESEEPIMLINKHIGSDDVEGQGVDGSIFMQELLALDSLNKKRIQIWINSPGGIVMDGYNIYSAILKTKTKVDTYCIGIAASIAAVIFQAGRNCCMADYSLLMYHNPYGGDSVELKKMRESIAVMIAERSGKSVEAVLKIMDKTTWMTATEAKQLGFCDDIEESASYNVKHGNTKAMWDAGKVMANSFINQNIKSSKMTNVANKLGLIADANEDSIVAAINALQNKAKSDSETMKKMEDDYAEAKAKLGEMEDKMNAFKKKAEEADEDKKKAEDEAKAAKAKNMIEGFVKIGKIKNESVEKWTARAIADFDGTKELLEELPVNGKAPVMNSILGGGDANTEKLQTMVIANTMNEIRNKIETK